jgi:BppU N-terminal domain
MPDLVLRQGDTTPALQQTILDASGNVVNLTGATVTFVMRALTSTTPVVNTNATILNAANGTVQYSWAAADTATAGLYMGEFHVTLSGGGTYTYPNDGYLDIWIEDNLITAGGAQIVSLGDVKDMLRITNADRTHDQMLKHWINALTPVIENIVGRVVQAQHDEWYDGGQPWISLRHRPALYLQAVSEFRGPILYPLKIIMDPAHGDIYSCMLDPDTKRRIVRRTAGGGVIAFPDMPQAVHVTYVAGRSPVPENIRMAALELMSLRYRAFEYSLSPWSSGADRPDMETPLGSPWGFLVPGYVREMLSPHKRHPSIA